MSRQDHLWLICDCLENQIFRTRCKYLRGFLMFRLIIENYFVCLSLDQESFWGKDRMTKFVQPKELRQIICVCFVERYYRTSYTSLIEDIRHSFIREDTTKLNEPINVKWECSDRNNAYAYKTFGRDVLSMRWCTSKSSLSFVQSKIAMPPAELQI